MGATTMKIRVMVQPEGMMTSRAWLQPCSSEARAMAAPA